MTDLPDLAALAGHQFDDVDGAGMSHREWMAAVGALVNSLGGTDGDGNVYTIEYDPDDFGLKISCVQPDGSLAAFSVQQNNARAIVQDANGNNECVMIVNPGDANGFFMQADGETGDHSIRVAQNGVTIDGVTVDPTQPWPGG